MREEIKKIGISDYFAMARPSHWFKNLLILPGVVVALILTRTPFSKIILPFIRKKKISACKEGRRGGYRIPSDEIDNYINRRYKTK